MPRQLRKDRECACDDAVLYGGVAAPDHAGNLLELARAMAESGDLEARVRAVLELGRNRAPISGRLAAAVGVVQDISKARVPGCAVSIKNLDGKNQEVAKVNAAGEFGFASIPMGHYAIEVKARGFAVGRTEVLVEAGQRAETAVTLPLGQISEAVTVRAARPLQGRRRGAFRWAGSRER